MCTSKLAEFLALILTLTVRQLFNLHPPPCVIETITHYHLVCLQGINLFRIYSRSDKLIPVSYTHLDVYKRQIMDHAHSFTKNSS